MRTPATEGTNPASAAAQQPHADHKPAGAKQLITCARMIRHLLLIEGFWMAVKGICPHCKRAGSILVSDMLANIRSARLMCRRKAAVEVSLRLSQERSQDHASIVSWREWQRLDRVSPDSLRHDTGHYSTAAEEPGWTRSLDKA